jgi:hypothetical protein
LTKGRWARKRAMQLQSHRHQYLTFPTSRRRLILYLPQPTPFIWHGLDSSRDAGPVLHLPIISWPGTGFLSGYDRVSVPAWTLKRYLFWTPYPLPRTSQSAVSNYLKLRQFSMTQTQITSPTAVRNTCSSSRRPSCRAVAESYVSIPACNDAQRPLGT